MLDAAGKAIKLTAGKSKLEVDSDEVLILALVRLLEIIGEAAGCITDEYRQRYSDIPWVVIKGMRNRLIRGYFDCNATLVWQTIQDDLPPLIRQLQQIIGQEVN
jgi:uncharacterized protein with HEPN domain